MATLADVIRKRRSSGQSRTGSLLGSIKDKFKEKIDPRQFLNQSGVLTALFPSLKAFKAKGEISSTKGKVMPLIQQKVDEGQTDMLKMISRNTEIAAKNYMTLPIIARDINVMRQNIGKLVRVFGKKESRKADIFFTKQKDVEKLYESNVKKLLNEESRLERLDKKEKKPFNWIRFFSIVGTGIAAALITDFLVRKDDSIVYKLYVDAKELLTEFEINFETFVKDAYNEIEVALDKSINLIDQSLDELIENFSDISLTKAIDDLFSDDKSVFDQFDKKIEDARKKISEGLSSFSIVPTAQAAIMPSPLVSVPETKPKISDDEILESFRDELKGVIKPEAKASVTGKTPIRISSGFGMRIHPITKKPKMHKGIDVAVASGTPIKTVKTGKVVFSGQQQGYGYSIEVEHDDKTRTFYAHLSRRDVNVGDIVQSGQVIGLSGGGRDDPGRGRSTGPHLHFELRSFNSSSGEYVAVNPGDSLARAAVSGPEITNQMSAKRDVVSTLLDNSQIFSDGEYTISSKQNSVVVIQQNNNVNVQKYANPKINYSISHLIDTQTK